MANKASELAFPFVGHARPSYLTWAEVSVVFSRAPTAAEKKQIVAKIPKPLGTVVELEGRVLVAMGGKPRDIAKLNAGIETWLHAAHAILPIALAYRRHDREAAYPQMTEWHAASLTRARAVVPTIEQPTIKKGKRSVTADLLAYLAVELE